MGYTVSVRLGFMQEIGGSFEDIPVCVDTKMKAVSLRFHSSCGRFRFTWSYLPVVEICKNF